MDLCYPDTTAWDAILADDAITALDADKKAIAEAQAWYSLAALCAYRIAVCPVTVRPCATRTLPNGTYVAAPVSGLIRGYTEISPGVAWYSGCGCASGSCGCGRFLSQVRLPGPVGGVASVMIDGELIAADRYRVDDGVYLVSLDEDLKWPASQDLRAANDEDGAFAVTYWHGAAPNSLVNVAVAALANEFYLALARDKACRLPSGVRSVARQGVVVEIDTMLFEGGYTRIREVDAVIRMYNPHRMVGQPRVLSPDVSKVRTPTFGGL